MNYKQIIVIFSFCFFTLGNAQKKVSIESLNSFIEEKSSDKKGYWTHLEAIGTDLIVYNQSNKAVYKRKRPKNGKLTFKIDKINTKKLKHKKGGVIIAPNTDGVFGTYFFNNLRKSERIMVQTNDMSKSDRQTLANMLMTFAKNYRAEDITTIATTGSTTYDSKGLNSLITKFILDYELTQKNYNISAIYSYLPTIKNNMNLKKVNLTTNLGGTNEDIDFIYKEDKLKGINYSKTESENSENYLYNYNLEYQGNLLKSINLNNKKKYLFGYNGNLLTSISYTFRDVKYTYNINYKDDVAFLELDVTKNDKLYKFTNKMGSGNSSDFIKWDKKLKPIAYHLDIYRAKIISYNDKENLDTLVFSNSRHGDNKLHLTYVYDENGNWIEQKNDEIKVTRRFYYK